MRYRDMKYAVKLLESEWDLGKKECGASGNICAWIYLMEILEETEQFVEELSATLAQVEAINKVDVSGVDLLEKTVNADTELRADVIKPSLETSEIVANAPESQDGAFLVPITVAEE